MNDVRSKDFKKKYLKCKYKLRQWEEKFFAENGRQPTRADIKTSHISIREYYKQYWKLKTQILEDQILGEDQFPQSDLVIPSISDGVLKEQTNTLTSPKKVEATSKDVKDVIENKSSAGPKENVSHTHTDQIDKDGWGVHLNKRDTTSSIEKEKCTLLNNVVVERLFEGSSFKKRNPRKALPLTNKKSNKSLSEDGNSSFDSQQVSSVDFFSLESNSELDISQDPSLSSSQLLNETSFSVEDYCSPNVKALISSSVQFSSILTRSKDEEYSETNSKQIIQPVSLIHSIASDPSVALNSVRSLNAGWMERCSKDGEPKERKSNCDSGFESMESSAPDLSDAVKDASHKYNSSSSSSDDDDDIIGASDNELDEKSRLNSTLSVSQKRKSDVSFLAEDAKVSCEKGNLSEEEEEKHESKKIKRDPYEFVDRDTPKTKEDVKRSILEKKMKSGTLNDNYVKINLKKKVFIRGKRNFNYARYKKQEWKSKKKNLQDESKCDSPVQCYKCDETGHFSRNCKKSNEDKLLSADEDSDETLPTLEEAEKMAKEKAETISIKKTSTLNFEKPLVDKGSGPKVEPYYQLNENGSIKQTPPEVYDALEKFGHSEFRPGQEEAIMRILSGQSTLLTIATGGGKSLCYQLPAYLYANRSKCITLVVSPLVSLMEDQVAGSSSFFKVGCLHTSQTQKQRESVIQDAKNGKLYALLVSPEAVVSAETFNGFGYVFKQLPPIAFACIDEVHCISQWSHNFRPSYLMISKVLKEKLGVTVTLGLTATATISTINSIVKELGVSETDGIIRDTPLPENLCLSVSRDEKKDEALLRLLKNPRFSESNSILIYCTRRDECERLAVFLRTTLQEARRQDKSKSKCLSWTAESYHAGMAASRRKQVQKAFMCGNLRIVVATIAFGMGINKQDIRGVIHYNMPKDFESYVQEVGRAGRDGLPAHCHLFLDSLGQDLNELRRHIYANSVDRHVLRKLLERVFKSCNCKEDDESQKCQGHEIAFGCSDTVQTLDIPEENIYTLLCYLELHPKKFVKVMTPVYINCKVKSYKGVKGIHSAAKKCPPLAYACALRENLKKDNSNILEFNVLEVANRISWDSTVVKNELKRTEWALTDDSRWKKTGIAVEFSDLGFRVCSRGDMTPSELDEALEYLIQRVEDRDKRAFAQLNITFSTFDFFASDDYSCGGNGFDEAKSEELKRAIRSYFEREELFTGIPLVELQVNVFDEEALARDVRMLLSSYRDNTFNGRAIARIFHGIQSPNYPASIWFKCKFWRKHIDKDFNKIIRIATREIIRLKP